MTTTRRVLVRFDDDSEKVVGVDDLWWQSRDGVTWPEVDGLEVAILSEIERDGSIRGTRLG